MSPDFMKLLEEGGPIAMTALIFYFWKQERADKVHYRELGEKHFEQIPKLTNALENLTNEVARRNKESLPPRTIG